MHYAFRSVSGQPSRVLFMRRLINKSQSLPGNSMPFKGNHCLVGLARAVGIEAYYILGCVAVQYLALNE
jgi:hypothetical protein